MQPGSLIFLVIVAVWAVYLVQHWIRRREHVATARSVDRFSEAMRILERREPVGVLHQQASPRPSLTRPSRSAGRPQVTVSATSAAGARIVDGARTALRTGPSRPASRRPGLLARRVRGIAFLATLVAIPVTALLSLVGVLLWVSVAVAVGCFVVTLAWLRASVRREQAVRRAARLARRPRTRAARPAATPQDAPVAAPAAESVVEAVVVAQATTEATTEAVDQPEIYDITAVVAAERADEVAREMAREWSPVPVPRPTYMLKDCAGPRPAPEPVVEDDSVPVPIEVEDDDLERLMAARTRRIG
ncbi:hypothetical protein [Lapillicoccus jejuensis]|uniref:Uncharacterized protein n=1 Tax=Lapillicoccus jejuensis TaxID=402171 RepID=A0A542E163_9MICO|nr:hypothetical protein [Lapillicoccus jejuensis]TQJ09091.1 hypothetical protein FB458_2196 [Lapillicoccus jejuensis]